MGGLAGLVFSGGPMPDWHMDLRDKAVRGGYAEILGLVDFGVMFCKIALFIGGGLVVGWIAGAVLSGMLLAIRSLRYHR